MIKPDPDKLGVILGTHGNKHVCESGVRDKKKTIVWDEIDTIYLDATKTTVNFILPAGESINLHIVSTTGNRISLNVGAVFRVGNKDKNNFFNIYEFIVSKIIDRQWAKLISDIEEGKRVSFKSFDITSSAIYRKKFFGGYDVIELYRIVGYDFENGEFVILFADDKARLKRKKSGYVREIPNLHLAQTFLTTIAQNNIKALNKL